MLQLSKRLELHYYYNVKTIGKMAASEAGK